MIPARGGSKGILRKNIKDLCGKPLIAWTIEAANEANCIERVIVSTEDDEIASIAQKYGSEVPFMRPRELALDDTPGIKPVLHAISVLPEHDEVLLLQPTSPLRTAEDIDGIVNYAHSQNASCVVSVCETQKHPQRMYKLDESKRMVPLINEPFVSSRQDLPPVYIINGALYWARCGWLSETLSFLEAETYAYVMPVERSIDIDSNLDWKWVELLINHNN